ncbi:MAG: glycosyltransferase [Actinomycetota bacterium]|nr:glycosyltransferase [Actinomycetota bacterium]
MQVIGSQRPYGIAKYLKYYGWEPIVLTVKHPGNSPAGIKIIPTEYSDRLAKIKKIFGFKAGDGMHQQLGIPVAKDFGYPTLKSKAIKAFREIVAFPDNEIGWLRHAMASATNLIRLAKIDAMISTSAPVTAHLIASRLKKKFKIPWIADLRDLWTQNHYYNKSKPLRFFEQVLELNTLSGANALVTISSALAEELAKLHTGKEIQCITNGFDPDEFEEIRATVPNKFSITHTGRLYNGKRDPVMLLKTLAKLIDANKIKRDMVEVSFYGPAEKWLFDDIKKFNLDGIVRVHGDIPRSDAIKKQSQSQLLLLLLWNESREKGVYTGKLFEYLGARRPILAIGGGNSIVKNLLLGTSSGDFIETEKQLASSIMRYYDEFVLSGLVKYNGNTSIEKYSFQSIAFEYAKLLNAITFHTGHKSNL